MCCVGAVWLCACVCQCVCACLYVCAISSCLCVHVCICACMCVNVRMCFQIVLTQEENWQPFRGWKQLHFGNHVLLLKSQLHLVIPPFHYIFSVSRFAMCMKLFLSVTIKSAAFHFHNVKSSTLFIRPLLWKLISSFYQHRGHLLAVFEQGHH